MKINELPSQEYLHECFDYDPESGLLTWKVRPLHHFNTVKGWKKVNTSCGNKEAGSRNHHSGYIYLRLLNINYSAHRIIWKLITGCDPTNTIDHDNNIKSDNRWHNLRPATSNENNHNRSINLNNKFQLKGVTFHICVKKYTARINFNKQRYHLGYFDTAEEAHKAYCKAALEMHKDFAHFG